MLDEQGNAECVTGGGCADDLERNGASLRGNGMLGVCRRGLLRLKCEPLMSGLGIIRGDAYRLIG